MSKDLYDFHQEILKLDEVLKTPLPVLLVAELGAALDRLLGVVVAADLEGKISFDNLRITFVFLDL